MRHSERGGSIQSVPFAKLLFLGSCLLCRYDAIIDLTRSLNSQYCSPAETQQATQQILRSLFPAWLLPAFRAMFSRPLPTASCRLNAWVTALTCQWLMGPSKVNDVELADGTLGRAQGVLIERCRYLEQSGCASICINSCKVPTQVPFATVLCDAFRHFSLLDSSCDMLICCITCLPLHSLQMQTFFTEDMALPLSMTPNYEDFSCQFAFGVEPKPQDEDEVFRTPCFRQCPSKQAHRVPQCPQIEC